MKPSNSNPSSTSSSTRAGLTPLVAASPLASPLETPRVKAISQATLRADLQRLRSLLEDSHPDPYLHAGGVVAFRRRFADAEAAIPPNGMTVEAFHRLVRPLVSQLGDGHSNIYYPNISANVPIWADLGVVEQNLVVNAVYDPGQKALIGAVVTAVEGVSIATLAARMTAARGHENEYANLDNLAHALRSSIRLAYLLERDTIDSTVRFDVKLPDGHTGTLAASVGTSAPGARLAPPTASPIPNVDAADMASGFLDRARRTAYFRIDSSAKYREAFEAWDSVGFRGYFGEHLDAIVREATGQPAQGDLAHRIASVPSVVERLTRLVSEMKAANTKTLVVDVRENSGGSSLFALILAYFVTPLDTILAANVASGYQIPRYSALYFSHRDTDSIEKVRARTSPLFEVGDLDFMEERAWRASRGNAPSSAALARARKDFEGEVQSSKTFASAVAERRWNAAWAPHVIVLTSATTSSAGFDTVLLLRSLGARVVGVPSGQAANCFTDLLAFELPGSHIGGQVSFKYSVKLPDDPENGRVLHPDLELTYDRYAAMGFDPNASVRLATELASKP